MCIRDRCWPCPRKRKRKNPSKKPRRKPRNKSGPGDTTTLPPPRTADDPARSSTPPSPGKNAKPPRTTSRLKPLEPGVAGPWVRGACRCARGNLKGRPKAWTKMTKGQSGAKAPDRNRSPAHPRPSRPGRHKNPARREQPSIPDTHTPHKHILPLFEDRRKIQKVVTNTTSSTSSGRGAIPHRR